MLGFKETERRRIKGKTIKDNIQIKEIASEEAPRSIVCLYGDWICIKSIICVLKLFKGLLFYFLLLLHLNTLDFVN
jgi:hypothetical protein